MNSIKPYNYKDHRNTMDEMIELGNAVKDGKQIQYRGIKWWLGQWWDIPEGTEFFNFADYNYRVKP